MDKAGVKKLLLNMKNQQSSSFSCEKVVLATKKVPDNRI